MGKTETFRKQHADLVKIVGEVSHMLKPEIVTRDAAKIKNTLSTLAGKISVHLAMEDEALYPEILRTGSPKAKETAKAFMKEMGSIKVVFTGYMTKWSTSDAMTKDPEGFIQDTKKLFEALGNRIHREDNELYPMVDAA